MMKMKRETYLTINDGIHVFFTIGFVNTVFLFKFACFIKNKLIK